MTDAMIIEQSPTMSITQRSEQRQIAARDGTAAGSVTELLRLAVERGTPVAELKELVALHEQMSQRQARQDFALAMAAFQEECPSIKKRSTAEIVTNKGEKYKYTYAELDEIARVINPIMAKHGLSYGWDASVERDMLTCICTVRHINGHSEQSKFTLPIGNPSAMNPQQKVGAALTFAQRRSLSSVLGLTTTDEDIDTAETASTEKITEDQATELLDLATEVGADLSRFLRFMGAVSIDQIKLADYARAKAALEQKRGRR